MNVSTLIKLFGKVISAFPLGLKSYQDGYIKTNASITMSSPTDSQGRAIFTTEMIDTLMMTNSQYVYSDFRVLTVAGPENPLFDMCQCFFEVLSFRISLHMDVLAASCNQRGRGGRPA